MPLDIFSLLGSKEAVSASTLVVELSFLAAAGRLLCLPLWRSYRPFLGFLGIWALLNLIPFAVNDDQRLYARVYTLLLPVSWIFYFVVARRLYQDIFVKYPGIAFTGRRSLNIAAYAAAAIMVTSFMITKGPMLHSPSLTVVALADRCILSGLSLFLAILLTVIARYPIDIKRNVAVHCMLFSLLLFAASLFSISDQLTRFEHTPQFNTIGAGVTSVLCILWAILLNAKGDRIVVRVRPSSDLLNEARLLSQLDALNSMLVRTGGK